MPRQSRSFADAGRRKSPEAVPRQRVEKETDRKQSRHGWSQPPNMQREIVVALPIGLESAPHLRAAAARHHAKTEMMAALRHSFYAACRHV